MIAHRKPAALALDDAARLQTVSTERGSSGLAAGSVAEPDCSLIGAMYPTLTAQG